MESYRTTQYASLDTKMSRLRFAVLLLVVFVMCLVAVRALADYAEHAMTSAMAETARERLALYSGTLHSTLNKYSYLPYMLTTHAAVRQLVAHGSGTATVNRYLENVNTASGSMDLFVLDKNGVCVAASNWKSPASFIGQDYSCRPYYQDAVHTGKGRYFGTGALTGKPGFYFSELIEEDGKPLGIAIAKVNLAMLQREWRASGETVFITDAHGVIFLSSREDWRYRTTRSLNEAATSTVCGHPLYGSEPLPPLPMRLFRKNDENRMEIDGGEWLRTTRPIEEHGWTIWLLSSLTALDVRIRFVWYVGAGFSGVTVLSLLLARVLLAWRHARFQAAGAEKIRAVNRHLAEEIRIRKKTERELLAAQDDLLHASRMAALGQMAASVVHELSQPVTSMGMFAASCRRLAEEGQVDKIVETVGHMQSLTRRIQSLIKQLRHFSRRAPGKAAPVHLHEALENVLAILRFNQEAARCVPEVHCPPDLILMVDALQLEQVCINLIQNALDAVSAVSEKERRVTVFAEEKDDRIVLSVEDTGPGIPDSVREKIFTPFFTTKNSGEGIGLGLAIADKIVRSLHGSITAHAVSPRGARFVVSLPRAGANQVPT